MASGPAVDVEGGVQRGSPGPVGMGELVRKDGRVSSFFVQEDGHMRELVFMRNSRAQFELDINFSFLPTCLCPDLFTKYDSHNNHFTNSGLKVLASEVR